MRFAIVGLLLIVAGIGLAEYGRRHPETAKPEETAADGSAAAAKAKVVTSMKELTESAAGTAQPNKPLDTFGELAADTQTGKDRCAATLPAGVTARDVHGGPDFAVFVVEQKKTYGIVALRPGCALQVLAVRAEPISALTIDGADVMWAENGTIMSVSATGGEPKAGVSFPKASIASFASHDGTLAVALVPKNFDPFSTEPTGAMVSVRDGKTTSIATSLVRPRDVIIEGKDAFFVAGFPSALQRAALDGAFSSALVEKADGPIGFDGTGVVYRIKEDKSPEVRRVPRAGGTQVTLATADVDWLAVDKSRVAYSTTGMGPRVYTVQGSETPVEAIAYSGTTRGVAFLGAAVALVNADDEGRVHVTVK